MKAHVENLFLVLALIGGLGWFAVLPARADTFSDGEFVSYSAPDWVNIPIAINLMFHNFNAAYLSVGDTLAVGDPNGFILSFTSATTVSEYLPTSGAPGRWIHPISTRSPLKRAYSEAM